jgi:hypothetical protein
VITRKYPIKQIVVVPDTYEVLEKLYALRCDGEIYCMVNPEDSESYWERVFPVPDIDEE